MNNVSITPCKADWSSEPAFQLREDRLPGLALFGDREAAEAVVPHGIDLAFHDDPIGEGLGSLPHGAQHRASRQRWVEPKKELFGSNGGRSDEAQAARLGHGRAAVGDAELAVEALGVLFDRQRGENQLGGNLFVAEPLRQER